MAEGVGYLHLFTLSSLVFAQPLLDLLARNAEFFVVRRSSGGEILALVLFLLLLPLPWVLLVALARRWAPRLGALAHGGALLVLASLFAWLTLNRSSLLDGLAWLGAGLAAGTVFTWVYHRFAALRLLVSYLAVALVAVPALFLLNPRIQRIVFSQETARLHESGAEAPIVFLLFDELSLTSLLDASRRIDPVSYPNLAAFASQATWFTNAVTVSDATELAVPAILTGTLPGKDRLPILEDYPHNLFTLFGGDYELWATEPITRLCPTAVNTATGGERPPVTSWTSLLADLWVVYRHLLLPPRFATRLPVISDRWQGFGSPAGPTAATPPKEAPEATRPEADDFSRAALVALGQDRQEKLRRMVEALDPEVDQALYFLHVLLPHTPWEYLPSGKAYATQTDRIPGLVDERWLADEAFVAQAYQRYLLQVQYVDRWFGELVSRLEQLELYDRSLIVFAADHGVSFRPGDSRRFLTETNAPDVVPVPLAIKAPGQRRGQVVERQVSTLDILPTVLDLLDVEAPWPLEGRSAFAAGGDSPLRRVAGKYRTLDIDESLHRDKYATLDWKLETFAGPDLLRAGTHPELYGRKVDEAGWREQDTVTLRLKGASLFDRSDAEDAYSPAFISGVLETADADLECCELAVAVNGTLYATTRTFGSPPDDLQFTALVPDAAFGAGANRVEVFRVRGAPEGVLERLAASGEASYALVEGTAGPVAIRQGARTYPVERGALRGFFSTERLPQRLRITGWAVDLEAGAAPEQILVFHRGKMVYSGLTTKVRHDVNVELGLDRPVRSAFQLQLPYTRIPESSREGLRLFAVSASAASELGFFYTLGKNEEGRVEKILATNAREIPVVAGALAGVVEEIERKDGRLFIRGWAADVEHRELVRGFSSSPAKRRSTTATPRGSVETWRKATPCRRSCARDSNTASISPPSKVFLSTRQSSTGFLCSRFRATAAPSGFPSTPRTTKGYRRWPRRRSPAAATARSPRFASTAAATSRWCPEPSPGSWTS